MLTIPAGANFILRRLMENGFDAYVVGGCVRDSLLGLFPHDWDICTSARPEQLQAVFADCRVIETGLKHGTLTVLRDRIPYEVTTFRVDGGYTDHRHPDSVSFVSNVVDDLARRDFTVNAMAWNPLTGLVDAFHGQEDLRAGIIRAVGDPQTRFTEDALRILRALRFASVYGFRIDDATSQAAHDLRNTLTDVAAERIRVELAKLLCGQGAADILRAYPDVLFVLLPQLRAMHGFDQHISLTLPPLSTLYLSVPAARKPRAAKAEDKAAEKRAKPAAKKTAKTTAKTAAPAADAVTEAAPKRRGRPPKAKTTV